MKTRIHLTKLLAGMTVLTAAASAYSLTIIPTFDSSITSDPSAAAMEAAINAAIQVFQSTYTDNATVKILFVSDPNVGLGQSDTMYATINYSTFHTALKSKAADANDTNALSKLPNGLFDPVINSTNISVTTALYQGLGLGNLLKTNDMDSTISFNPDLVNLTRPGTNPDNYDLEEVLEHEIDEVLGTSSDLPDDGAGFGVNAMDLFRYTTNLSRTFTTSGHNAYFSVDGTNLWARYNQESDGDYGDFWSDIGYWAPPGQTAGPQVQDAYATSGQYEDIGVNEKAMLDVVGWTLAVTVTPPVIAIAPSGASHVKLSWSTNASQFTLQESTNLSSSVSWIASATGSTNPATILSSSAKKFYRLVYQPPGSSIVLEQSVAAQPSTTLTIRLRTQVHNPRGY